MGLLGDLGGIVDSVSGGRRSRREAKAARGRGKDILGIGDVSNFDRTSLFNARENYIKGSNKTLRKGYQRAYGELQGQGNQAKRQSVERGEVAKASAQQSLNQRGLSNTTVVDAATRGIDSDVSRQISDINESLGAMYADLALSATHDVQAQLGRNLEMRSQTAWDWFKFTVGGAGFAPGESNAFGFQGSPHSQPGAYDGLGGQIGGAIDSGLQTAFGYMGGGGEASSGVTGNGTEWYTS